MGQYYIPTLIHEDGTIETISSHDFDNGSKLMEHSWVGNDFVNAVYSRILENPLRIAWMGDYANDYSEAKPESYHMGISREEFTKYYDAVWDDRATRLPKEVFSAKDLAILSNRTKKGFLINRDTGVFLDLGKYIQRATVREGSMKGYCANPLPLLTACGNGRGGGDFFAERAEAGIEDVGAWAFHKLEYTRKKPTGLKEAIYTFIEK